MTTCKDFFGQDLAVNDSVILSRRAVDPDGDCGLVVAKVVELIGALTPGATTGNVIRVESMKGTPYPKDEQTKTKKAYRARALINSAFVARIETEQ